MVELVIPEYLLNDKPPILGIDSAVSYQNFPPMLNKKLY